MLNLVVVGDSCLDTEVYVDPRARANPEHSEAPLYTIVQAQSRVGMAGNVVAFFDNNSLVTVPEKYRASKATLISNFPYNLGRMRLIDSKTNEYIARLDSNSNIEDRAPSLEQLEEIANIPSNSIVVVADYCKGFITEEVCDLLFTRKDLKVYVDSKSPNINKFYGATIKVNHHELYELQNPEWTRLVVTRSDKGSEILYPVNLTNKNVKCKGAGVTPVNVSGAGDVFFSAFIYAENWLKYTDVESLQFATAAAGLSIEKPHTYIPFIEEIHDRKNTTNWTS